MDILAIWMEWNGRVPPVLGTMATIALIVGELCLLFDLIGRVLGTYVRTPLRVVARILLILLACAALAAPFVLGVIAGGGWATAGLIVSLLLSVLVTVNFLFPYHFGIRRIGKRPTLQDDKPLVPGAVLRRIFVWTELPAQSPAAIRCLVLSDLHCNTQARLQKLRDSFAALGDERYDLVLVLGDLGEKVALLPQVIESIAQLRPKYGVYAVRGNHDCETDHAERIARLAQDHSIALLSNIACVVPGLGIEIVGLEYPWLREGRPERSTSTFAIGLTHTPDNIMALSRLDVPLALAGHTHGGKARLPWIGSFPVPSKYGRFLDEGWFQLGRTQLYISPGFGYRRVTLGKRSVLVELTITDRRRNRTDKSGNPPAR
jgi:predicted MPP superfamily phosphohydrolase